MKSVTIGNMTIGEGIPKICVPIVGITEQNIFQQINQINTEDIDLIEWRSDWYEHCFDISKVLQVLNKIKSTVKSIPILFTPKASSHILTQSSSISFSGATYTEDKFLLM